MKNPKLHQTPEKQKSFIHNWLGFLFQSMISMEKTPARKNKTTNPQNPPGTKLLRKIKERRLGLK